MKMSKYWENNFYNKKLTWAFDARNEFLDKLKNENSLQILKLNPGEVRICLFGSSGVGKTTLLLKLLGINDAYFDKVAYILRCGQPKGDPSTPTAFIYKLTDKEEYSINNESYTEKLMEKKLIQIRSDVENGVFEFKSEPIHIGLPLKYFHVKNEKYLSLKIIDLPGFKSKNVKEQPHVREIIRIYTELSDLILLIEKADSINSFFSINYGGLKNWKENSIKYRLITTYSISPSSHKEKLKKLNVKTKKDFIKSFREAFSETSIKELPEEFILYPLEYGDSWNSTELYDDFRNKYNPILNELFEDLRNDIIKSTNEYSRLLVTLQHQNNLKRVGEKVKKEFEKKIDIIKTEINILKDKKIDYDNINIVKKETRKNLNKKKIESKCFVYYVNSFINNYELDSGKQEFLEYIEKFKDIVREKFEDFKKRVNQYEFQSKVINEFDLNYILRIKLNNIRDRIGNRIKITYFIYKSDDLSEIHNSFEEVYSAIKDKLNEPLRKEIYTYNNKIEKKIEKIFKEISENNYLIEKIEAKLKSKNIDKKLVKEEMEKAEKDIEHDISICNKFENSIKENFIKEYNLNVNEINTNSKNNNIFQLTYLFLLINEFKKLITSSYEQRIK